MNSDRLRQFVTLFAILGTFIVNALSNIAPLTDLNIGEIANTLFRDVLILPANYAFVIWGLIYLGLIAFGIYQALPAQRTNPRLRAIGYWLAIACLAQIVWVFLFQFRLFGLSILAMLGILVPLIVIYRQVGIGQVRLPRPEKWLVQLPFSIYLGWISVATIVNVATALYSWGWNGGGISPIAWTILVLVIAAAIALTLILKRNDYAYGLVITWALVAIAIRQANQPSITFTAIGLAIILTLLILIISIRRAKLTPQQ